MKEDVVAANLANLRQSINELKKCIEKQNTTVPKPEQSVKMKFGENTIYNGVAKTFCSCWNDALSVVKKHVWKQQPDTLPFSLWFPKLHIPVDTRSAFPMISVQSPVSIQYRWQS